MDFPYLNICVRSYTDRCLETLESISDICAFLITAYQKAYSRIMRRRFDQIVNNINIIIEFARKFRSKRNDL